MSSQAIPNILKSVFDAFNAHDLNQIMSFFDDDCVLEMPRGGASDMLAMPPYGKP